MSSPRITILSASSGYGRCNDFASSHSAPYPTKSSTQEPTISAPRPTSRRVRNNTAGSTASARSPAVRFRRRHERSMSLRCCSPTHQALVDDEVLRTAAEIAFHIGEPRRRLRISPQNYKVPNGKRNVTVGKQSLTMNSCAPAVCAGLLDNFASFADELHQAAA